MEFNSKFLSYLADDHESAGILMVCVAFGIPVLMGLSYLIFKRITRSMSEDKRYNWAIVVYLPAAATWLGGFIGSILMFFMGIAPIRIFFVIVAFYFTVLAFVISHLHNVRKLMDESSIRKAIRKGK